MDNSGAIARSLRRHVVASLVIVLALGGGVGVWASSLPLSGAVVAAGRFVVESSLKQVQHLTGGVVGQILVRDGDVVRAGDVVVRLEDTETRASLAMVTKRLDELEARRARLEAERDGLAEIVFPESLMARIGNEDVALAMRSEENVFAFRAGTRDGARSQLIERVAQYHSEIEGYEAQVAAIGRGLAVIEPELADLRALLDRGLVQVQRVNTLDREAATLEGNRGELTAMIAQARGRIAETELQALQIDTDLRTEVGAELRDVLAQIGEYAERRIAAEEALRRVDIVAPQDGVVHQLAIHTVGGVIGPAEVLMTIVPDSESLTLEVEIAPGDIDQLQLGQPAILRLSAFNQRTTPELNGHVSRIAADLTQDQRTGLAYYQVRVSVPPEEIERLGALALVPGMPAEVFIQTGERTALSYLMKPLTDQINRAFREE